MTNPNLRFPKSLITRLTTDIMPNFYTLSVGLVMRALMKKPLGSLHPNSDMLWNSFQISSWCTLPNMALCQVFPNSYLRYSSFIFEDHTYNICVMFKSF